MVAPFGFPLKWLRICEILNMVGSTTAIVEELLGFPLGFCPPPPPPLLPPPPPPPKQVCLFGFQIRVRPRFKRQAHHYAHHLRLLRHRRHLPAAAGAELLHLRGCGGHGGLPLLHQPGPPIEAAIEDAFFLRVCLKGILTPKKLWFACWLASTPRQKGYPRAP